LLSSVTDPTQISVDRPPANPAQLRHSLPGAHWGGCSGSNHDAPRGLRKMFVYELRKVRVFFDGIQRCADDLASVVCRQAILEFPPRVPKSTMLRSRFQSTARNCGKSVSGSIKPFSERPAISPLLVIQTGALLFSPGSAPKSVMTPLVSRTAPCQMKQSI